VNEPRSGPVRTIFFGSGRFALAILDAVLAAPEVELVGVVSVPDRPVGRRGTLRPTPVAARAGDLGLRLLQPARIRDEEAIAAIDALRPGLGVLADYGRIVPAGVLELPAHGILNVHPSLLPRHRGASPIPATIVAGDERTGVTLIRMDAGLDTGPIVAAVDWPLDGSETADELETRAADEGGRLVRRTLAGWLDGTIRAVPQDPAAASLTRPLRREDGRLDPTRPATELARLVRAYRPWPGTFVETALGPIKVLRAEAVAGPADRADDLSPGTFEAGPDLRLRTGDGVLVLTEVQPGGGRPMTGAELVRGRRTLPGSRLATPTGGADGAASR
jgi:methionyl-tRNA formyltransferase